jgi:hypothetical protein
MGLPIRNAKRAKAIELYLSGLSMVEVSQKLSISTMSCSSIIKSYWPVKSDNTVIAVLDSKV